MENINHQTPWEVAEIKLTYNVKVKPSQRPKIETSEKAYEILKQSWNPDTIDLFEQFKVLLTNRAHKVLGIIEISSGGIAGTVSDPKLIFAAALKAGASGFLVAHNHPSGNLNASQCDILLTKKLKEGGKLLEIQLLDHIIITSESYMSFADEGIL